MLPEFAHVVVSHDANVDLRQLFDRIGPLQLVERHSPALYVLGKPESGCAGCHCSARLYGVIRRHFDGIEDFERLMAYLLCKVEVIVE
ncbi:hypothetical protein D3C81_1820210 [compost metagenome]